MAASQFQDCSPHAISERLYRSQKSRHLTCFVEEVYKRVLMRLVIRTMIPKDFFETLAFQLTYHVLALSNHGRRTASIAGRKCSGAW